MRRALAAPPARSPVGLAAPLAAAVGDGYGPRGDHWHAGLDFPAPAGQAVVAPGGGRVAMVGHDGGWGRHVVIDHGSGVRSLLAHLSSAAVAPGQAVAPGALIGRVGATGAATGPHLHLEVTVRGANVDPATALAR